MLPSLADVTISGEENQSGIVLRVNRLDGQRAVYISANLKEFARLNGDSREELTDGGVQVRGIEEVQPC